MSKEQDVDLLEVLSDTMGGFVGRVMALMTAFILGCFLVVFFTKTEFYEFRESMEMFMLSMAGSILTGLGIVAFPSLLLFAIAFVKKEWPYWSLIVPFWAPWLFYTPPF